MRLKPLVNLLLSFLLLIGAVASMWLVAGHRKARERRLAGVPESRARLVEALGSSRPFEGRLLGMSYASFDPARARKPLPRGWLKDTLALVNENRDGTEAERLSNAALVYGLGNELDLAIQNLTRATTSAGVKPWMWSDLSVFYLARFRQKSDSLDLLKALDSSAHAQGSSFMPPEVRFNYALVLEKFSLSSLTHVAWKDYIARDRDSAWSAEARIHLRNIQEADVVARWGRAQKHLDDAKDGEQDSVARALVREFPQYSREYGEEILLGRWGKNWLEGNLKEARHSLSIARALGRWLGSDLGEHMLEDSVSLIDQSVVVGGENAATLARNHYSYRKAIVETLNGECHASQDRFHAIGLELEVVGSPFSRWALLRAAICQYQSSVYEPASENLLSISNLPHAERYPVLVGTAFWTLGLIQGIKGDPAGSLGYYQKSLQLFSHAREDENYAKALLLVAECLGYLGDLPLAWDYSWQSLQRLPQIRNGRKKYGVLSEAANLAVGFALPEAALRLMDEALQDPMNADPLGRAAAYFGQATLCVAIDRIEDARSSLAAALQLLPSIKNIDARLALRGDLFVIEGEILARNNLDASKTQISKAIDFYRSTSYVQQLQSLLLERARIDLSLHRLDLAEADLLLALRGIERERVNTPESGREALLDTSRKAYDEMARVQFLLGRKLEAFRYIEGSRSRSLLDHLPATSSLPLNVTGLQFTRWLQRDLPSSTVIVEYQVSGDSFCAWVLSRERVDALDLGRSIDGLEHNIRAFRESVGRGGTYPQFRETSAVLFDALIRPLLPRIASAREIVFVPDGALYGVSFPALLDRESGRFLIERFSTVVSPSAMIHAVSARGKKTVSRGVPRSILTVGNPLINRWAWASLPDLGNTAIEAQEVAGLYPSSHLLLSNKATPISFLEAAPRFRIIHVAAHAISDAIRPSLSMLILSPDSSANTGALYAHDIGRLRFHLTSLVVLNACGSLGARIGKTEGLSGLASSFLQAGVPTVIGTLWGVEDSSSRRLSGLLHRWIRKGLDPAHALRAAQVTVLREATESVGDSSWASFEAFGS